MKTTEKTTANKIRKPRKTAKAQEVATKKVFVTGPWRSGSGEEEKDYWRVRVGLTPEDKSAKYNYKMFGPIERVMDMAQRIAADQKLELSSSNL